MHWDPRRSVLLLLLPSAPLHLIVALVELVRIQRLGGTFVSRHEATGFLQRTRRANSFLEELRNGNLERECYEEKCSYEEAREIFPQAQQLVKPGLTDVFWFPAPNLCLSSPCQNGATCTRHLNTFTCKCAAGFHGISCYLIFSCLLFDPVYV
uniref:Coagulation factor VII, like n=1 Tax=Xiphophorus couchianus TaxID=32473 RepID=A0A3B5MF71_9TELE